MEAYRARYKKCVVPGCTDEFTKRHTFPINNVSLFNVWVQQVQNPILDNKSQEQIYKCYRVCDLHFAENHKVPGTKRGLHKKAFPTLLLPHSREVNLEVEHDEDSSRGPSTLDIQHSNSGEHARGQLSVDNNLAAKISSNLKLLLPSGSFEGVQETCKAGTSFDSLEPPTEKTALAVSAETDHTTHGKVRPCTQPTPIKRGRWKPNILRSAHVTRQEQLTPKARKLSKTVVDYGSKLSAITSQLKSCQNRLRAAGKGAESVKVDEPTYNFIMLQIKSQHEQPNARKFTLDDKTLAPSLMKSSGTGYKFLSKISNKTLTKFLAEIPLKPGMSVYSII